MGGAILSSCAGGDMWEGGEVGDVWEGGEGGEGWGGVGGRGGLCLSTSLLTCNGS